MFHQMALVETYPTNAERWSCSMCDRQLVLQWQPFKKLILIEGNDTVQHTGTKGGLTIHNLEIEEKLPDDLQDQINDILSNID